MEKILCPSMMCADYECLGKEVETLCEAGADIFHCDIMDGSFVPNFAMGIMDIQTIRRHTDRLIDCHLMMENPSEKVDWFVKAGADIIYIHPESERYVVKTLAHIKKMGAKAGIAVNPDTSVESIKELLNLCDYVMVMTVNPGFAGQGFLDFTREKIAKLAELKEKYGYTLMIDGHCSPEIISEFSNAGVDGFILGTSALFRQNCTYEESMQKLRNLA